MVAMEGHIRLLRELGHTATLLTVDGKEMKIVRVLSAKFIFFFRARNPESSTQTRFLTKKASKSKRSRTIKKFISFSNSSPAHPVHTV